MSTIHTIELEVSIPVTIKYSVIRGEPDVGQGSDVEFYGAYQDSKIIKLSKEEWDRIRSELIESEFGNK